MTLSEDGFLKAGRAITIAGERAESDSGLDVVDLVIDPQFIYTDGEGKLVCSCCGVLGKSNGAE